MMVDGEQGRSMWEMMAVGCCLMQDRHRACDHQPTGRLAGASSSAEQGKQKKKKKKKRNATKKREKERRCLRRKWVVTSERECVAGTATNCRN